MTLRTAAVAFAIATGSFLRRADSAPAARPGAGGSSGGCGSDGAAGGGGSGGAACPSVIACGGDVVGTWTVTSSCLTRERRAGSVVGRGGLPVRAGHGIPPGDRNVHRQRRRDVFGRHDHDGRRAIHVGALVPGDLVDAGHLRRRGEHHQEPGLRLAHLHARDGRRLHLRGHRPPDRRARASSPLRRRRAATTRPRATWSRSRATRATCGTRTASRGQADRHPAEHEPDDDGHDRAPEERQLGHGRHDGQRRHDRARAARRFRRHGGRGRLGGHGRHDGRRAAAAAPAAPRARGGARRRGGRRRPRGRCRRHGGAAGAGGGRRWRGAGPAARAASSGRATSTRPAAIPASRPTAP